MSADIKQRTAKLSIISNTLLIILKLVVGLASGAVSIISEAAHSVVDLMASIITYYAVKKSSEPPDEHHAYGHGKIENLSGAIEALLIVFAAIVIVHEAIDKIKNHGEPEFLKYGIIVMLISIAVNIVVSRKLQKVAILTESPALEADALHLRADIWTSVGVLVGLVAIKISGCYWLDPAIAIIIAGFVLRSGFRMTMKSFYELSDISLPPEEEAIITEIISKQAKIISFHNLRTRRSGSRRLIDVHIILHKNMHLDIAHNICDQIEAEIEIQLGTCDIVIHIEPCDYHSELGECPLELKDNNAQQ